jgi:hypothetical protein
MLFELYETNFAVNRVVCKNIDFQFVEFLRFAPLLFTDTK